MYITIGIINTKKDKNIPLITLAFIFFRYQKNSFNFMMPKNFKI